MYTIVGDVSMESKWGKEIITYAYVDSLPKSCMSCPFMGVDNHVWGGIEKGYVSTQWCSFCDEEGRLLSLDERWRDKRDDKCPLRLILAEPIDDELCDYYNTTIIPTDELYGYNLCVVNGIGVSEIND